jgi:hypothetical protein
MAFKRIASQIQQFCVCVTLVKEVGFSYFWMMGYVCCFNSSWLTWCSFKNVSLRIFWLQGFVVAFAFIAFALLMGEIHIYPFWVLKFWMCLKRHLLNLEKKLKTLVNYSNYREKWTKLYSNCVAIRSRNLSIKSLERFTVENCLSSNVLRRRACFMYMLET